MKARDSTRLCLQSCATYLSPVNLSRGRTRLVVAKSLHSDKSLLRRQEPRFGGRVVEAPVEDGSSQDSNNAGDDEENPPGWNLAAVTIKMRKSPSKERAQDGSRSVSTVPKSNTVENRKYCAGQRSKTCKQSKRSDNQTDVGRRQRRTQKKPMFQTRIRFGAHRRGCSLRRYQVVVMTAKRGRQEASKSPRRNLVAIRPWKLEVAAMPQSDTPQARTIVGISY